MTFALSLNGPPFPPKRLRVRGRMSLRLIERPEATTDMASGRN